MEENKKEIKVTKVEKPDYIERKRKMDKFETDLRTTIVNHNGLESIIYRYNNGVIGRRRYLEDLAGIFMFAPDSVLTLKYDGIGEYTARVWDLAVSKGEDGEISVALKLMLTSIRHGDMNTRERYTYGTFSGNTINDAIYFITDCMAEGVVDDLIEDCDALGIE